jgi:hypothetical protein
MSSMFTDQPASVWAEIMPQIIHVHSKSCEFDESGSETGIPCMEYRRGPPADLNRSSPLAKREAVDEWMNGLAACPAGWRHLAIH